MALTPTVTKKSVTQSMNKMWNITLNLSVMDGVDEVINKDFNLRYRTGQDVAVRVKTIGVEMQDEIDSYKGEQVIFNHAQLDTAVTWINNNLEV